MGSSKNERRSPDLPRLCGRVALSQRQQESSPGENAGVHRQWRTLRLVDKPKDQQVEIYRSCHRERGTACTYDLVWRTAPARVCAERNSREELAHASTKRPPPIRLISHSFPLPAAAPPPTDMRELRVEEFLKARSLSVVLQNWSGK